MRSAWGRHSQDDATTFWSGDGRFGECPVWRDRDSCLYWLDIPDGVLRRLDVETGRVQSWSVGTDSAGLALTPAQDALLIGRARSLRRFDLASAVLEPIDDVPDGRDDERINDLGVDPSGNLWVATMHTAGQAAIGRLLRRSTSGAWDEMLVGMPIVNGPAFDPARGVGYVCDSDARKILRFSIPGAEVDGGLGATLFASFTERDGHPDGIAVDAEGGLWVAHYGAGCISRWDHTGRRTKTVNVPARHPTAVVLGGDAVFITSAASSDVPVRDAGGAVFRYAP